MKKLIAVVAALPLAVFAQQGMGPPRDGPPGPGAGRGGQGRPTAEQQQQLQKRARLALTLGLAVALDLDEAHALKLGETVGKYEERRRAAHQQIRDAKQTLRRAASGEKATAQEVDQAIAKVQDGRAQLQAVDRELVAAVTKDLAPEKKARAVLFLSKFQSRFGRGGGPGMMMHEGRQHHRGMMRGPGGGAGGPGPGMRGGAMMEPGPGPGALACGPDCDWDSDDE